MGNFKFLLTIIVLHLFSSWAHGDSLKEEAKSEMEALVKLKPKKSKDELGLWLEASTPTVPYYVHISKPKKNGSVVVTQYFADGSGGKGANRFLKTNKISLGGSFGDHYRIFGRKLSIWDKEGKIHDLTLVRWSGNGSKK